MIDVRTTNHTMEGMMPPRTARLAGLGALGAAAGLLVLAALFGIVTRPGPYAGLDTPSRALAWGGVAGVLLALSLVHVVLGRQLLAVARGDRPEP